MTFKVLIELIDFYQENQHFFHLDLFSSQSGKKTSLNPVSIFKLVIQ